VGVHPLTRNPAILGAIARERGNMLGVYCSTVEPGRVAVGDPVELEPGAGLALDDLAAAGAATP
jgi:MOSC domain-containing protein